MSQLISDLIIKVDLENVAISAVIKRDGGFDRIAEDSLVEKIKAAITDSFDLINTVVIAENQITTEQRNKFFNNLSMVERDEFNDNNLNFEHTFYRHQTKGFWIVIAASLDDCVSKLYASQNVRRKKENMIKRIVLRIQQIVLPIQQLVLQIKQLILRGQLTKFKEKITEYAFEWESYMEKARVLAGTGKIKEGHDALMQSAKAINKIINCYRAHKVMFNAKSRNKIDQMLLDSENGNEDSLLLLIKAVQLINSEIETELEDRMKKNER